MFGNNVNFGGMPGFNRKRKSSIIANGDWDKDGVKNIKDCSPLNHKKQDTCAGCGQNFAKWDMVRKGGKMYCEVCATEGYMTDELNQVLRW